MTTRDVPVGACGDAAPTGDPVLNAVAYARGVLQVEADTCRHQRDQARHVLARVVEAYDHGTDLDLDITIRRAVDHLNSLKDKT